MLAAGLLWTGVHLLGYWTHVEQQFFRWADLLEAWRPAHIQKLAPLPDLLQESSGLAHAAAGGYLSINDSGNTADLYHIDLDGTLRAIVPIPGLQTKDLEALASGPCPRTWPRFRTCIYMFDTGDNLGMRSSLAVHTLPDPTTTAARIPLVMPIMFRDGPRDIEAGAVDRHGRIWLINKGRHGPVRLSQIDFVAVANPQVPIDVGVITEQPQRDHGTWFTGADIGQDGSLYLRTYSAIFRYAAQMTSRSWLQSSPDYCFLADSEPQGEAILSLGDGLLLTSSESNHRGTGWLRKLRCTWKPAPQQAWQ